MYKHEVFKNAPIVEALLDIRVSLPAETGLTDLDRFTAAVSDRFPDKETRYSYTAKGEVKIEPRPEPIHPKVESVGYQYRSQGKDKVVQARIDGFSFSKLKPYTKWSIFRDEAYELWGSYRKELGPIEVTRIALRYINRIELPLPVGDFRDYVLTSPEIAPGIPQALIEFFFRLVIPKPEINAVVIITSTIEPPKEGAKSIPYIFDIDAFRAVKLRPDADEIWEIFETLCDYKNEVFFNSITERAKELFR